MYYGFDSTTPGWKEERKEELIHRLSCVLADMGYVCDSGFGMVVRKDDPRPDPSSMPYVEVDALGEGVRIRHITYLSEKEREELTVYADRIYRQVMEPSIYEELNSKTPA